ncbi:MAG: hypothetical protein ACM3NQ_12695 [Bacteroidales bacterium]
MKQSELVIELATRAGVSRADAGAVLRALAEIIREQTREGTGLSLADMDTSDEAGAETPTLSSREAANRPAYADSGAPVLGIAPYVPSSLEVDDLIAQAAAHPLGIDFLMNGQVGAVAVTFGCHAFTVEAARERLGATAFVQGRPV